MMMQSWLPGLNMHTWPFAVRVTVGFLVLLIGSAVPALIVCLVFGYGISWSHLIGHYADRLILLLVFYTAIWWTVILGDFLVRREHADQA